MVDSSATPVTVHMIGNAHIDPVWLWTMSEGREEVQSTYRTAIGLIRDQDAYVFTSGGSITYKWVSEDDPALFTAIQEAVAQGRWWLVNGWWLQPDCNIPSGESFARHALYGQRYLQEHFGRRARVGYNVDTFGHAGTLPQLLKLGGLDRYVFFRPGPHEKTLPKGPFWWEAPDGSRVLTVRPPLHYGSPGDGRVVERLRAAAADAPEGQPIVMCFYGVGNHGGGPTRQDVEDIVREMQQDGDVQPLFSTPDAYFDAMTAMGLDWPVVRDDLQHHARGCYSVLSRVKRENRESEHLLMQAERWDALAALLVDGAPSRDDLRDAWDPVLFNQFHDILAGTSIRAAYEDVWDGYQKARDIAARVQGQALARLSAKVNVQDRARPVLVWNPLAWERTDLVRLAVPLGGWRHDFRGACYPGQPVIHDEEGAEVPSQLVDVELDYNTYIAHIEARVQTPALGERVLYVDVPEVDAPQQEPLLPQADTIENAFYRLRLDPESGWLASLLDKRDQAELLAGPANVPVVIDDPSDTWSHDVVSFRDEVGRFTATGPVELAHDGAVRKTLRVQSAWGSSTIVQEITLYPDSPAIDVTMTIDWHERLKMLKLAFPLAIIEPKVTASAPYGWIARPANGEEEPCQSWVDLSGQAADGRRGLCLVNDSKYGYDALEGELRLSVLRCPIYAFHRPREIVPGVTYHYVDQGVQVLRYRLLPHKGGWETAHPDRQSLALHEPLLAERVAPHTGIWDKVSLLRVSPENVVLTTVKWSEDGRSLLARGYEATGQAGRLELTSEALGVSWSCELGPHEIWSCELPRGGGMARKLNLLEEPLDV
ncbi:MAG: alpha-mannosidase [Anaerolineae bacterium]